MNETNDYALTDSIEPTELKKGLTRLWNAGDIALISALFIFLFFVGSVMAFFSVVDLDQIAKSGGDMSIILEGANNFVLLMASLAASIIAGVGSILVINAFRPKHSLSMLGFRWPEKKWFWMAAIISLALLLPRIALVYGLIELFPELEEGAAALEEAFEMDTMMQTVIVGLVASIVVPIWEEMFFRGFIHNAIRNCFSQGSISIREDKTVSAGSNVGMWISIVLSSLIFAIFHGIAIQAIGAFVLAVGLAWLYEKSDSLWPPIFAHALNNGLAVGLMWVMSYFSAG